MRGRQTFSVLLLGCACAATGCGVDEPVRLSADAGAGRDLGIVSTGGTEGGSAITPPDGAPNIIVFLVDDMGWRDSEVYGSEFYESPEQARLAAEGLRFTQAYAAPLCSPTRAALLTGMYPGARLRMHKAIVEDSVPEPSVPGVAPSDQKMCWPTSRDRLPLEETTVAETLRAAGYRTIHIGKWHLGHHGPNPDQQGFDTMIGVGRAATPRYFSPYGYPGLEDGPDGEYLTDRFTDEAIQQISDNRDRPFFMYLAHVGVHCPFQAKDDRIRHYEAKVDPDGEQRHPVMAAMLDSVDESLGRILDCLDQLRLSDNTLFVFLSDNGGVDWKADEVAYPDVPITSNAPLRAGKVSYYEGGVRVPMILRWPARAPAGVTSDVPVHVVDLFPTILEAAGLARPNEKVLDGRSLTPLLERTGTIPSRPLFLHFPKTTSRTGGPIQPGGSSVRQGDWKLIRIYGDGPDRSDRLELFNLREDIGETNDLARADPTRARNMNAVLEQWLQDTDALVPIPNPDYEPPAAE